MTKYEEGKARFEAYEKMSDLVEDWYEDQYKQKTPKFKFPFSWEELKKLLKIKK